MIGQTLRQFRIEQQIGSGAMGVVYRAVDEGTGRPAAVKVITGESGARSSSGERFVREAKILQRFRHPNIVRFLGGGQYRGTLYIAMEFITGVTLDEHLVRREFLPWPEVVELGIQLCEALEYAHEKGVIHRDLKPSNLMITPEGQLKLTDFGIAKDLDATALTGTGRTMGTAAYMAPEQITGSAAISHKTDLYALGCVLYQMLTGQPPFAGKTAVIMMQAHLTDDPPRPSAKSPDIPKDLDNLVLSLMSKFPSERPLDAEAVAHRLRQLRDKAQRGEPIAMVFGPKLGASRGSGPEANPTVLSTSRWATRFGRGAPAISLSDPRVGTALLALALLGGLGLGSYLFYTTTWPSQQTLYRKAAALMASDQTLDWKIAQQDYIEPLDRRFPDHPYRAETRAWRDRIFLHKAKDRARILDSIGAPRTPTEELYVAFSKQAIEATKLAQPGQAAQRWRELATVLEGQDAPEDRQWWLLARSRAEELETAMAARRQAVAQLLDRADAQQQAGRGAEAVQMRLGLLTQYGPAATSDPELARLLDRARAGLPPAPAPAPTHPEPIPGPASGVPETPPSR
jgi:hypothetical protein